MTVAQHKHVASLDGLRGLAALGIVIGHTCGLWGIGRQTHLYIAVPFFFTLSGYVIARSYEHRLSTGMSLKRFAAIRLIRLYPMLFMSLIISAIIGFSFIEVGMGLFFIPSLTAAALFPSNGPQWSLFMELLGNAVHAIIMPILTDAVLVTIIVLAFVAALFTAHNNANFLIGWSAANFFGGVSIFALTYPIGILIFRLEKAGRLPEIKVPLLLIAGGYILFSALPQTWTDPFRAYPDLVVSSIVLPLIVVFAIRATAPAWLARWCKVGGDLSYPVYIIHHPILVVLGVFVAKQGLAGIEKRIFALAVIFAICAGAYALLKLYDEPIRKMLSARLLHRKLTDQSL